MGSHNLDRQPNELLLTQIRNLKRQASELRTLQLQGSDALSLAVVEGYFTIPIPTTVTQNVELVTVSAPTATTIMIGNLMWSMFYVVPAGAETPTGVALVNYDDEDLFEDHLTWEVFLAYDTRGPGEGTLASEQAVFGTTVADNQARICAKVRSSDSWIFPVGPSGEVIIFYQIRATMM